MSCRYLLILFLIVECYDAKGVFRFASHYADHMVLQRAPRKSLIWGFGEQNATVTIEVGKQVFRSIVIKDHRGLNVWKVQLTPFPPGGPYEIKATSYVNNEMVEISMQDIYFGDVWVCGGQSNMAFPLNGAERGEEELRNVLNYDQVRLFAVQRYRSSVPVSELEDKDIMQQWTVPSENSLAHFSAVCWIFGRRLYDLYKIPIGLVSSNFGGTAVEEWSSPEAISNCPPSSYEEMKMDEISYSKILGDDFNATLPVNTELWNSMIYPLLNTTIYGVIWYQGEQNANYRTKYYDCTFPAMIDSWRKEWHIGTYGRVDPYFPFGFVQLAPICKPPPDFNFPDIRWKQTAGYGFVPNERMQNVFMSNAMDLPDDVSEYGCVHPLYKTDVVERLVLGARALAYKENVYWSGPIAENATTVADGIRIDFKLESVGENGIQVKSISGFEIETAYGWYPTVIKEHNTNYIILETNVFRNIKNVRYAWKNEPCPFKLCAIYSKGTGIPSPSFILQVY